MRRPTRYRLGTIVAASAALFVALLAPPARAGDTDVPQAPAQRTAACTHAASFRTVVDVGHGTEAPGALSARGIDEYDFNLRLAKEIEKQLHAAGFDKTVLMITSDKPPRGLFKRVARANALNADLFLAVHHDSVPDRMMETWQVDGKQEHYNDRFPGHSLFVSYANGDRAGSLAFAHQLGLALKAHGLQYTPHYTEKFMGSRRRELLDRDAGVYRFDQLVVLKDTRMPAALLEAGSIVNRQEELLLATPEHEAIMADAVVEAVDEFCTARAKPSGGTVVAAKKPDQVAPEHTGTVKKRDQVAREHAAAAKKPDQAQGEHAAAESGTWSFLRNLKLLTSAHARTREAATK